MTEGEVVGRVQPPSRPSWKRRLLLEVIKLALVIIAGFAVSIVVTDPRVIRMFRKPVQVHWAEQRAPADPITIRGAFTEGQSTAPVAIVEYADFECPACAQFARTVLPTLRLRYVQPGILLFVFRHFPLERIHSSALRAAEAAQCAGEGGKFWEMYDSLFLMPDRVDAESIRERVQKLGLNATNFDQCAKSIAVLETIRKDTDDARRLGLRATPTFLVGPLLADGRVKAVRRIEGAKSFEEFQGYLDSALRASAK